MFGLVPYSKSGLDDLHNLLSIFNEPFFRDVPVARTSTFKVDVKDNGDSYELLADLPGLAKEEISVDYQDNYLTISAERNTEHNEKDDKGNYVRRERHFGSLARSFYIDGVDDTKIEAEFKDGVLKISLPKLKELPPKVSKIAIK